MQARKDLFHELKSQKSKIARISNQMTTIEMVLPYILYGCVVSEYTFLVYFQYDEWNAHDKLLLGYIKTNATPQIFYLPTGHTPKTEQLLSETQSAVEGKGTNVMVEVVHWKCIRVILINCRKDIRETERS